jgi:hypothetical protein
VYETQKLAASQLIIQYTAGTPIYRIKMYRNRALNPYTIECHVQSFERFSL